MICELPEIDGVVRVNPLLLVMTDMLLLVVVGFSDGDSGDVDPGPGPDCGL